MLGPASVAARFDRGRQDVGVGTVDDQDEHATWTLRRVRDLDVVDADAGVGRQRRDLGQHAGPVRHRDPQLSQVLGSHDAGREIPPGRAGPLEGAEERVVVPRGDAVTHHAQVANQCIEGLHDGQGVLGADVGPDAGMAGRDPGHVAEAPSGQAQQGAVLLARRCWRRS